MLSLLLPFTRKDDEKQDFFQFHLFCTFIPPPSSSSGICLHWSNVTNRKKTHTTQPLLGLSEERHSTHTHSLTHNSQIDGGQATHLKHEEQQKHKQIKNKERRNLQCQKIKHFKANLHTLIHTHDKRDNLKN